MGILGKVLVGALAFWGLSSVIFLVSRGRKGFLRLGLKEVAQSFVQLVGLVWILFLLMLGILLMPALAGYLEGFDLPYGVAGILPTVCTLSLVLGYVFLLLKIFSWTPRYTDKEKEFLREAKVRMKRRLGPLGRLVRIDGTTSTS